MPEFDTFTTAYMACALWSSGSEFDAMHLSDLADETVKKMADDCAEFQAAHADRIDEDLTHAGHDFWLTRNGHGAGFWDGDWPEPDAAILTEACKVFGEIDIYIGDDLKIYH